MDRFVTTAKSTASSKNSKGDTTKKLFKYNPFPIPIARTRQVEAWRDRKRTEKILAPLREKKVPENSKAIVKHPFKSLNNGANPMTRSDIRQRSEYVDSCATGHQRSDSHRPSKYVKSRNKKLGEQLQEKCQEANGVLQGVRIYVGGYMMGTTDIEMKRHVILAGGKVMHTAAEATHILTSQGLSGSKTHKYLQSSTVNKVHIVRPEWVLDSIATGKRKTEWDYIVIKDSTMCNLGDLGFGPTHAE